MASSVTINGQTTSQPGIYADPKYTAAARSLPRAKVLAIVGEFPELENGVLGRFTSGGALVAAAPVNASLEQAAAIAFGPASDPSVGSPAAVVVASTLASTAATSTLSDALSDPTITLASKLFGTTGNQIAYTLVANGTDTKKRNLTTFKQGSQEPLLSLGSGAVVQVRYVGTFATEAALSCTGPFYDDELGEVTSEVAVNISKDLTTVTGTYAVPAADRAMTGKIKILTAPGVAIANETLVTISGASAAGVAITEVVTLAPAFDGTSATTASWSRVDSVVVAVGSGTSLVKVQWTVVKVDKHVTRTLAQVAGFLGDLSNLTAAIKNARASSLTLGDLDVMQSVDCMAAAADLRCDNAEFVRQVNAQSSVVTAERVLPVAAPVFTSRGLAEGVKAASTITMVSTTGLAAGDAIRIGLTATDVQLDATVLTVDSGTVIAITEALPHSFNGYTVFSVASSGANRVAPNGDTRVLAGGTTGTTTTDSLLAARAALSFSDVSIISVFSFDAAIIRGCYDHAVLMAGIGANECLVWAAFAAESTKEDIDSGTIAYNSRHIAFVGQSIRVIDPRGNRRLLDPRYQALQCAAMQAGVSIAEPITAKYARVVSVVEGADWDGTADTSEMIQLGLTVYRRDTKGYQVARAVTSYRASDDVNQSEVSANESVMWQIKDMREELLAIIGRNSSEILPEALAGNVIARGRVQVIGKLIRALYEDTVQITQVGDTGVVTYDFEPSVPYNFVILKPNVRQVSFSFSAS